MSFSLKNRGSPVQRIREMLRDGQVAFEDPDYESEIFTLLEQVESLNHRRDCVTAIAGHLIREIMPIRRRNPAETLKGKSRSECWNIGRGEGMKHALLTFAQEYPEINDLPYFGDAVTLYAEKVEYPPFEAAEENYRNKLEADNKRLRDEVAALKEDSPA